MDLDPPPIDIEQTKKLRHILAEANERNVTESIKQNFYYQKRQNEKKLDEDI